MWSSVTRSRAPSTRVESFPRNPPCTCQIWRLRIRRTASRRASVSSSSAGAKIVARCGWPRDRELRSMAETAAKAKAERPTTSGKPPRPEKGEKSQQAQKPDKGGKPGKGGAAPPAAKPRKPEERVTPRLKTYFDEVIRKKLSDEFGYKNRMQVPVIEKVVINMGIGEGVNDRKKVEAAANDLSLIAGQKAGITKARKSIATFKRRERQPTACKVTLLKTRMYEFVDRLINIALPRVRDFRGLSPKSFAGAGNYTIGIKEPIIFPDISYNKEPYVWVRH